ncbi:MAG: hypothetical protein M3041_14080 [Acidobacteriota bacterium]|nr:hypothetical protein [Acidobacteriota bacterium]
MKKIAILFVALQVSVLSLFAADAPKECTLCVGATADLTAPPSVVIPLLLQITENDLATTQIDTLSPAQRAKVTLIVGYSVDRDKDPLLDVETHTKTIIEWARLHGPFEGIGVIPNGVDTTVAGYAIKRLAVMAQGLNVATRIVLPPTTIEDLNKLSETGALNYIDALIVSAPDVAKANAWITEKEPSKKLYATVEPPSPNAFFDLGRALADGATRAFTTRPAAEDAVALANFNSAFAGDWAFDSTASTQVLDAKGTRVEMPVLTFVRGEDLRTIIVPRGDATSSTIASLPSDRYTRPRRIDAAGDRQVTDVGAKGGHFLIGVQPVKHPFLLTLDHTEKPQVTKEAISVATQRGITVEEIIRNHQAYKTYQESIQPRYIARDATKLRFTLEGGEAIEATISGDFFSDPHSASDWVWQDFYINGVRWKYGRIPELPLIQPEKVAQLPLDIHLTNEYRYQLVRETDLNGYHTYEVRFEPPPNAAEGLPLYRGTVWIDSKTWSRIRITMVQLNLTGEVLSNEERVDFQPFARATHEPLIAADVAKTDAREIAWLPLEVSAQQVVSAAGRANVVLRQTTFSDFRLEPSDYEQRHQMASASDSRIVRETQQGMRYIEKNAAGERVVKEGFDTSRTFMVGGIHHDSGLQFPVLPLGGIDYFNFDWDKRGIQTNVFFAGVVLTANATNPNVANTRTNIGADFFGIAVATSNAMYRFGLEQKGEAVKQLPTHLSFRAGHPFLNFGKIDVSLGLSHTTFMRDQDTAPSFAVPSDTFEISPGIDGSYSRWGYTLGAFYDYNKRTTWKPWGILSEFNPNQKTYSDFGGEISKSFYLPKFQRLGIEVNYLDGTHLDRFSEYELGFFGSRRIHGIRSGSVRAEKAILGHLSYGFVLSDQLRMEAFYDHGLIDDHLAGYHRELFQGVGIGGQTVGPYGTLLRLDIGKTVGRNAQNGFVANIVFLKLF